MALEKFPCFPPQDDNNRAQSVHSVLYEQMNSLCICDLETQSIPIFSDFPLSASRTDGTLPANNSHLRLFVDFNGSPHFLGQSGHPSLTPPDDDVESLTLNGPLPQPFNGREIQSVKRNRPFVTIDALQTIADRLTVHYTVATPSVDTEEVKSEHETPKYDYFAVDPRYVKKLRQRRQGASLLKDTIPEDCPIPTKLGDDDLRRRLRKGDIEAEDRLKRHAMELHGQNIMEKLQTLLRYGSAEDVLPFLESSLHTYEYLAMEKPGRCGFDCLDASMAEYRYNMEYINAEIEDFLNERHIKQMDVGPFHVLCFGIGLYGRVPVHFNNYQDPAEFSYDLSRFWPANKRNGGFKIW